MNEHSPARGARIKDVARIAGVSTATVSRTLSNPDIVSEDTRKAVLAAVDQTGYSVNLSARHLRQQRTGGILALAPNLANPFFSEILSGISDVLRGAGLNLIVGDTSVNDDARVRLVDYANRARCDGLIVLDGSLEPEVFTRSQCPPVVQACEWITGLPAPRVFADNEAGAELVVDHLAGLGHRRIGRVSGPPSNSLTRSRDAGFRRGLERHGLAEDVVIEGDFSLASGQAAAERLCASDDRPTAIFCDNDEMACGLMGALRRAGLRVPDDLSVVGFDDIELSRHLTPALTTVHQPRKTIGLRAAEILLERIEGRAVPEETRVPVSLCPRDSTAAPPG
ncbi:periplasmic binding protein/LacI transcriptional regulator [Roseivivax marinus]|uniref:Periplasmic binding protein/LacI transcriptional regulator n=1 Tax=Roseivivax marinus TaxID=1379903 RepID=W4HGA1_9RHOB|nr:LacI family DNA-binding transcriptional regulator [Roseivivax marinus]ETW11408.1 periplasmic binding protein/LacI transcriptional regulator [Roseivivax marinus]